MKSREMHAVYCLSIDHNTSANWTKVAQVIPIVTARNHRPHGMAALWSVTRQLDENHLI